jgi:hypothetical protein
MSYTPYYPTGCSTDVANHICNPCEDREHGRIRSIALIKDTFTFVDPTNPVEWEAGILTKDIRIIAETNGSFDGGSPKEGAGYGNSSSTLLGYDFNLKYKDPNYKDNCAFYNSVKNSRVWKIAYRTENLTHMSTNPAIIIPRNTVADDLTSEVVWDVEVKWSDKDLPCPFATPEGVFTCFLQS